MTTDGRNDDRSPRDKGAAEEDSGEELAWQPHDGGLSLEDLGNAYAELLGKGHDPYAPLVEPPPAAEDAATAQADQALLDQLAEHAESGDADDGCEISPRTIVEAMLFIGHPQNEPTSAAQLAALMRGVRPEEIEGIVRDLNESYREQGCPYAIVSEGAGFRLALLDEFRSLRDRFYGRVKDARLSQAAIDVLALVAYNQPLTREGLDALRDKENGALLTQLVRRRLLQVERLADAPRIKRYRTTDRFLAMFGLASLDDLPRTQELER